jgi:hypothetical protein
MADAPTPAQGEHPDTSGDADQKLANLVNSVVSSHLKRSLGKALDEAIAPLREQFSAQRTTTDAPKSPKGGDEVSQRIAALEAELSDERKARKAEQSKAREDKAYLDLRAELTGKVRPEALDHAVTVLRAHGKVKVSADGRVSFKHADADYDLQEGVAEWVRSKDASLFVPPPAPSAKKIIPNRPPSGGPVPVSSKDRMAAATDKINQLFRASGQS